MLTRLRAAGLLWPTLLAIPALAVLIGLGSWQMSRKAWKDGLIAQIHQRVKAEPMPLADVLGYLSASHPPDAPPRVGEYTRVRAAGTFDHGREQFLYAPHPQFGPGYHVYTPLMLENAGCPRFVIVNRGFVPDALRDAGKRPTVRSEGRVEVVGLLRQPETPGTFTPNNDPQRNMWFWRDLQGMAKAMSPSANACPVHFFIDAEAEPANPGGWPRGGASNLVLPNRHLEYALTWYGLALTLIGVFAAFARGRLRQ